jgi:nucleoside 2-deoxyribosyltransferase
MTKRFYLATRRDRADEANAISAALNPHGWERTLTWSTQEGTGSAAHSELAKAELRAVAAADVLIVMLPGGYGTHVEIGAALALGKPVILHAPDQKVLETPYPCVFHYHPSIKLLISETLRIDELLSTLLSCA